MTDAERRSAAKYRNSPRGRIVKRAASRRAAKRSNAKCRAEALEHYGNKCACCGEAEPGFLTVDHIDGKVPELEICGEKLGGVRLYRYLIANNFPSGYQCLCSNCNMAIGWWGICPHKIAKVSAGASGEKEVLDIVPINELVSSSEGIIPINGATPLC